MLKNKRLKLKKIDFKAPNSPNNKQTPLDSRKGISCPKPQINHDNKYLNYIRSLKCVFCGKSKENGIAIHPHHLPNKKGTRRSDDYATIPVCFFHHRELHDYPKVEQDLLKKIERTAKWLRREYENNKCSKVF